MSSQNTNAHVKRLLNNVFTPYTNVGYTATNQQRYLEDMRKVRDGMLLRQYPVLPGAVFAYIDLAAGREWAVSGPPTAVVRAVEWLNNAQTHDHKTGMTYYGFEQFIRRRAMDHLTLGRTAFVVESRNAPSKEVLEYLDPSYLIYRNPDKKAQNRPTSLSRYIWEYENKREFRKENVVLNHPFPVGSKGFIAPIEFVLQSAWLLHLLLQHDNASLDGRKVKDIFVVGNPALNDGIEQALEQYALNLDPGNETQHGIPIVEVNNSGTQKVADQIHMLGLSQVPETFDRAQFIDMLVNQIAGSLGISLRHFWNNEKTTNRALEEVQEQRQQQKGPSAFIRSEERLINNSGILKRFGTGENRVQFGFIEEVDMSSKAINAEVLLKTAEALEKMAAVFGTSITPESYLGWMQTLGAMPNDLELADVSPEQAIQTTDQMPTPQTDEQTTVTSDSNVTAIPNEQKSLPYGFVTMDSNFKVLDTRRKFYTAAHILKRNSPSVSKDEVIEDEEAAWQQALLRASQDKLKEVFENPEAYEEGHSNLKAWQSRQTEYPSELVETALHHALDTDLILSPQETDIMLHILSFFK